MSPTLAFLFPGLGAVVAAVLIAALAQVVAGAAPSPDSGMLRVVALFLLLLPLPLLFDRLRARSAEEEGRGGPILLATTAALLAAAYFFVIRSVVFFPADFLLWPEGDFVLDILKLRTGYPLYTAPANLESFTYTPGAQALTDLLARLSGQAESIPAFRVIQVGYVLIAAVAASWGAWRLLALTGGASRLRVPAIWGAFAVPFLLLAATNALSNPFVHYLHNDALALLVATAAYVLLVEYAHRPKRWHLLAMVLLPGVGFLVKQSLAIWAPLFGAYLLFFDRPRSVIRAVAVGAAGLAAVGLAFAACYRLWGAPFMYWTVTVLGSHPVSIVRSIQHALDLWAYFAIGVVAGLVTIPRFDWSPLTGLWLVALALLAGETYTSGIAWMLNHAGPGSLLVAMWALVALPDLWRGIVGDQTSGVQRWLRTGGAFALICLLLGGFGMIRPPLPGLPPGADEYRRRIEAAVADAEPARVLIDYGAWIHFREGVIPKDHASPAGEVGYTGTADFTGLRQRLDDRFYQVVVVRALRGRDFTYDHYSWPQPSGLRDLLLRRYREVERIPAVGDPLLAPPWFKDISVLVPVE